MWGINLNRDSEISLSRQIYQSVCRNIYEGNIKQGEALPSTRELSEQIKVSRSTVTAAYNMLIDEGFIISRQGAPTRAAVSSIKLAFDRHNITDDDLKLPDKTKAVDIDNNQDYDRRNHEAQNIIIDFKTGKPDVSCFPKEQWSRLLYHSAQDIAAAQLNYSGPEGLPALRMEIADWLFRSKGIDVNSDDIYITSGSTQALHILAQLLAKKDKVILIEDPCHTGMLRTLENNGHKISPVPVDEQGLRIEYLDRKDACAVYVTPSHQFPLGGILPINRRMELIKYAKENDLYIIEDDYDSEFRYIGAPISPLYSLCPDRVVYVGTFSKSVFPAIRIGFVILPKLLKEGWRKARIYTDVQNPILEQAVLAEFLRTRRLDRHVNHMRKVYRNRRLSLLDALKDSFEGDYNIWGDAAGLHLAVCFPDSCFDRAFVIKCRSGGLAVPTVDYHSIVKGRHMDKLLIGYGHLKEEDIQSGVKLLKDIMHG